jgi:hypothetical protein
VNTVMILHKMRGISWLAECILSFSRRTLLHVVSFNVQYFKLSQRFTSSVALFLGSSNCVDVGFTIDVSEIFTPLITKAEWLTSSLCWYYITGAQVGGKCCVWFYLLIIKLVSSADTLCWAIYSIVDISNRDVILNCAEGSVFLFLFCYMCFISKNDSSKRYRY